MTGKLKKTFKTNIIMIKYFMSIKRWGAGDICQHGSYYTCDDRYNPGKLQNHKWENCKYLKNSEYN
jgi:hypothetical protein